MTHSRSNRARKHSRSVSVPVWKRRNIQWCSQQRLFGFHTGCKLNMQSIKCALSSKGLWAVQLQRFATAWLWVLLPPKVFQDVLFQAESRTSNKIPGFQQSQLSSHLHTVTAGAHNSITTREGGQGSLPKCNFFKNQRLHCWFLKYRKSRRAAWLLCEFVPLPRRKKKNIWTSMVSFLPCTPRISCLGSCSHLREQF